MRQLVLIASTLVVCAAAVVAADEWTLPEPASFHARGMSLVAEIFPPASRQNDGSHALCYVYEVAYPGTRWDVKPTLKWRRELVNDRMPVEAIVSQDGWLATFNDWGAAGAAHAIVIYDRGGRVVADWSGDRLFADPALAKVARQRVSMSSVWWNQGAKYYFSRENTLFIAVDDTVIRVDLTHGSFRVGSAATFRDYRDVAADLNADTEIWKTSLRFSSITDVLAARRRP